MSLLKKLCLMLLLLTSMKTFSQNLQTAGIDNLAGQFIQSLRTDTREKIFAQTDKWFYTAGEKIHFSAYCINALSHKISRQSKTVYADLVDDKENVIAQLLLNNSQQKPEGNILLPQHVSEGYYWLRIYTNAMLHRDSNSIYVQPLYVFNSMAHGPDLTRTTSLPGSQDPGQPQFMIFPEGGYLISGTNSVVAFRCMDKNGKPLEVSGYLSDGLDTTIAKFKTSMPGYGKFDFYVWKSRKYTAHIKWNNKDWVYALPAVNQFASQLSVTEQTENNFRVQVSMGDSLYKKNKQTYLLAVSRDSLCFAATGNDMYEVVLPKANFPEGKATLLLFNDKQQIVSERNIYVDRNNLVVSIHADKSNYGAREKVNLDISAADSNNRPIPALLSMSVESNALIIGSAPFNMIRHLNNDNIELPQNDSMQYSRQQWDIIMLTQKNQYAGWSYIEGKFYSSRNENQEDSNIMNMHGKILDVKDQPQKHRIVTLISNERTLIFQTDTTDEQGDFHFVLPEYMDSTLFTLQVTNLKGAKQNDKIVLNNYIFPNFKTPVALKKRFPASTEQALNRFKTYQLDSSINAKEKGMLKEVIVKEHIGKTENYDVSKRVSQNSMIIASEQIEKEHVTSLLPLIQQLPGIHNYQGLLIIGGPSSFKVGTGEPLLVVDGVRVSLGQPTSGIYSSPLTEYLAQLTPSDVDFIEVIKGADGAAFGVAGGNGVILVNTRTSGKNSSIGIALMKFYPKGYHTPSPFESPNYDLKEMKKSTYPDLRSTIYWNGNVLTDNNGKASVNFFTADPKGIYTVTIEGITANGTLVYKQAAINKQ